MRAQPSTPAARAARIAGGQRGVITYRQLLSAGFSRPMVGRWVGKGLLHREFRGVYRFGHAAPSPEAHHLAAVMAFGPGAVLSGLAAAWVYGLIKGPPPTPEVTVPVARSHPGVTTHRVRRIDIKDTRRYHEIPITSLPRTLIDLAAGLPMDELALACHQAEVRYKVRPAQIDAALSRLHRPPGVAKLRAIVHGDHPVTLSRMERGFLALVRAHRFPRPKTNAKIHDGYVDCRWPGHRLTVELDSYRFHNSRHAWSEDRRRDRAARARGDEHRRYTWADIFEDSAEMLAELALLLPRA